MSPGRYRKKPVTIEAVRWDGTGEHARQVVDWVASGDGKATLDRTTDSTTVPGVEWYDVLVIHTLEGPMTARPGDWIIRGVAGEFYPCKPDIFAATYEEAS